MSNFSVAAVAVDRCKTELREFKIPEIPADAGLLRVVATGMCGADWPMYQNEKPGPRILGHEIVGTIERLGEVAGDRWGVKVGDLVALEEYLPCGHCDYCRSGEFADRKFNRPHEGKYGTGFGFPSIFDLCSLSRRSS